MRCPNCGTKLSELDEFCFRCGEANTSPSAAAQVRPSSTPTYTGDRFVFADFFYRLAAWLLDGIIVFVIIYGFGLALDFVFFFGPSSLFPHYTTIRLILSFFTSLLYFSIFESSTHQATPGKMALGIIVTDIAGQRISFGRAVGRELSKIINWLTLGLGFLTIGFTAEKRGIHDYIAGTLVIKKER